MSTAIWIYTVVDKSILAPEFTDYHALFIKFLIPSIKEGTVGLFALKIEHKYEKKILKAR